MYKKILFLFFVLFLCVNVFATSLVSISNNENRKTLSINEIKKNNYKFVNDFEIEELRKQGKRVNVIAVLDVSSIRTFQDVSIPTIYTNILHNNSITGLDLNIGVVDSGISYSASYSVANARDFTADNNVECIDADMHGCLVSSVIANKNATYKGVAYDSNIVSGKIFNSLGRVPNTVNFIDVFDWVISNNVSYINNSWGTSKYDDDCDLTGYASDGSSNALIWDYYDYNKYIDNIDLLLVFAAGNDGECASEKTISNDCSSYNSLCVGAMYDSSTENRNDDVYVYFSSRGPTDDNRKKPDLTAPGTLINSQNYINWEKWNGTSASAPHATASSALLSQFGLNALEVKALLINSADDINSSGWDKYTGWGYINLQNAYNDRNFVSEQSITSSNYEYDFDFYNVVLSNSNLDYYSLDFNEEIKCSIVWKRVFEPSAYLQNYDLYLISDSNSISNSLIDNVEQVYLENLTADSYLKVHCNEDNCLDINYALACNIDYNRLSLDYYPVLNEVFYVPLGDGNYNLVFDFNSSQEEDFNVNIYSLLYSDYFSDTNDINLESIKDNSLIFTLNSDLNNASNLYLDLNIEYFDSVISSDLIVNALLDLNILYLNTTPEYLDDNVFYISDFNLNVDLNFYNDYIYSLDYNDVIDYNVDGNKINYSLDFNAEDFNYFGRFDLDFNACNVFGSCLLETIYVYTPTFTLEDYYIDFDENILYYKYDFNSIDLNFNYNENKDYNIFVLNVEYLEYSILKDANLFYYSLDLNNSEFILKDNLRDLNVLHLSLIQNPIPEILTDSITRSFNINIQDNDLNILATELTINGNNYSFNTSQDGNNYYVSGSGLGTVGTHTLQITVYDYSNNSASKTYTYTINPSSPSGGGGGGSPKIVKEVVPEVEVVDVKEKNIFDNISELEEKGSLYFDERVFKVVLYDENRSKINNLDVRIYDSNTLVFEGKALNDFDFTKYQGKTLKIIAYSDNELLLNKDIFVPFVQAPKYDINNESIMPFKDENVFVESASNNFKYYFIALGIILILIIAIFLLNKKYRFFK